MKKIIKIIITFLFLIATYNVVSKAAISATSKTVNSGENFSISVTSNVSVSAYTVKATDYSGLTFVTSSGGTGAGTTTISDAKATGGMTSLATFQFKAPNVEKDQTFRVSFSASGMGDVNLSPVADSSCTATITVKAKNQASASTEDNVSQTTTTKSNVTALSNLGIRPNDFSGFKANKTSYSTEVPNDVETIEIYAEKAKDNNGKTITGQKISGTGKKTLKVGSNKFEVVVTAENGQNKTYTINVTRKAKEDNSTENETTEENTNETIVEGEVDDPTANVFGLTKLSIEGVEIQPQFQTDVYEYRIELKEDLDKLDIEAMATEENANIEIVGNENLQDGENIITILVNSDDESVAYQIIVNKSVETQEEETNTNKIKNIIIISTVAVLILIVVIIIVVSKVKSKKNEAFIPYGGVFEDDDVDENNSFNNYDNNDADIEENNDFEEYEEEKPKKKRSKGKRFK